MSEPEVTLDLPEPERTRRMRSGRWPRSEATQLAVLTAAKSLFAERGYDGTSINDIVKLSGVSVGSIYHQFGGKAEVFMALVRERLHAHTKVSHQAISRAETDGETRPLQLYVAGAKAFLMDTWKEREFARIYLTDDGPPGWSEVRREADAHFIRGAKGLPIGKPPLPDSAAYAVTGILHAGALQIITVGDRRTAAKVADYFCGLILRLSDDGTEGPQ